MNNQIKHIISLLRVFSPLYSSLMVLRQKLYKFGFFKSHKMTEVVVSVGNLTMGGSGKTPFVIFLAQFFKDNKLKPAIISRGYGGKANKTCNIVSNGKIILLNSEEAGDEPRLIAEKLEDVPVLTGKKRILPCKHAIKEFDADLLVLDDGFQHLSVKRDLDLVLFNCSGLKNGMYVFPGGVLREPFSALDRCHAIIFTGFEPGYSAEVKRFKTKLNSYGITKPFFSTSLGKPELIMASDLTTLSIKNSKVIAFSGIANPNRFKQSIGQTELTLLDFVVFKDHHSYSLQDIEKLIERARIKGATHLITTEKDYVKLKSFNFNIPLILLKLNLDVPEELIQFISVKTLKSHTYV